MSDEEKLDQGALPLPLPVDENDDIIEYITDSSFESLKKRFGEAEEDQEMLNEDFNPLSMGAKGSKRFPDDDLRAAPSFKKDIISSNPVIPLQNVFGSAESIFDSDAISFDDIELDLNSYDDLTEEKEDPAPEKNEPENTPEIELENTPDDSSEYNTNTRVIYIDNDMDDGIKRNTDLEVSNVFSPD